MKNLILFGMLVFVANTLAYGQDNQWYIKNNNGRSTGLGNYGNSSIPNEFKISNIFPASCSSCASPPRKDIFVIYKDGTYYNTRPFGFNLNGPISGTNDFGFRGYGIKEVSHFYLSNIYQGDDPPQAITVTNYSGASNYLQNSTSNTLKTDHDIVGGKDITLIIPKNLFDTCGINENLDLSLDLSFFSTRNVFDNAGINDWSFHDLSTVTVSTMANKISGIIPPPVGFNYQFLNFSTPSNIYSLIGSTKSFILTCSSNNQFVSQLDEPIREFHDPNYIKVECIFKKYDKLSKTTKFYIQYSVHFENEGNDVVDDVTVKFNLPSVIVPGSLQIGDWFYGGVSGCGVKNQQLIVTQSYPYVSFKFSDGHSSFLADQNGIPANRKGWIKFCAESNRDPFDFNVVSLQPTNPMTNFETTPYVITNFIDPHEQKSRPQSTESNCKCFCKVKFTGLDVKAVPVNPKK